MSAKVKQVLELLNGIAPLEMAEEWDNVGLLVGDPEHEVTTVLCALDLTCDVIAEAILCGAELIVTHHPVMFRGRKTLREDDHEGKMLCSLVRAGISLIAMHTNFDNSNPGVNDALAEKLGLCNIGILECGMRIGEIKETEFGVFADAANRILGGPVRRYGDSDKIVKRIAVLGGAGEDFAYIACENGADVYLTGEMSYHKGMDNAAAGLSVLEAGHAATELPGVNLLRRGLQNALNEVQYKIRVLESKSELFL